MNNLKIATWIFYLLSIVTIAFGCIYLFSPHIMSYHLNFLGVENEEPLTAFNQRVPELFHALMRIIGSSTLAIGMTAFFITFFPFQKKEKWAWWSLFFIFGVSLPGFFLVTYRVAGMIPAGQVKPPFLLTLGMIACLFTGLCLSWKEVNRK